MKSIDGLNEKINLYKQIFRDEIDIAVQMMFDFDYGNMRRGKLKQYIEKHMTVEEELDFYMFISDIIPDVTAEMKHYDDMNIDPKVRRETCQIDIELCRALTNIREVYEARSSELIFIFGTDRLLNNKKAIATLLGRSDNNYELFNYLHTGEFEYIKSIIDNSYEGIVNGTYSYNDLDLLQIYVGFMRPTSISAPLYMINKIKSLKPDISLEDLIRYVFNYSYESGELFDGNGIEEYIINQWLEDPRFMPALDNVAPGLSDIFREEIRKRDERSR